MAKKNAFSPIIFSSVILTGSEGTVIGGGSGHGGLNQPASPMSFDDWKNSDWAEDLIQNGIIDEDDYAAWWESWSFTKDQWEYYNPNLPWEDYFG
jgi:hypothetical protein